ncbi:cytochrome P450 4W1-like protein [Leptotrombidium deliense]|uniref:Cytochrome P450 4W1-like protein n=1 Tax=Leptotrombidium deliense TaxID=299467 RepID=A0A443S269_9ACAR|nr:cytochrome P450 4W1-like protein [Leptotrombidium deliense]
MNFQFDTIILVIVTIIIAPIILIAIKHTPCLKPRIPIFGNVFMFYRQNVELSKLVFELALSDIYKKHKNDGMALAFIGNQEALYLFKPSLINEIFKDNSLIKKAKDYEVLKEWLGNGLLVSHGKKWRNDRKIINQCFTSQVLEDFIPSINDECIYLVQM